MSTTLSSLLESLSDLKSKKKNLDLLIKETEKAIDEKSREIMQLMDKDGLTETANGHVKVSIDERTYPQVENWDLFLNFIYENKYLHLLQRRPAVEAYRELLSIGRAVPGVVPFPKRTLAYKEQNQ